MYFFCDFAKNGGPKAQQVSDESSIKPDIRMILKKHLTQTFSGGRFSRPLLKQTKRLGSASFSCSIDPAKTLSWLAYVKRVLDESMECSDEDKVKIARFMLEGNA